MHFLLSVSSVCTRRLTSKPFRLHASHRLRVRVVQSRPGHTVLELVYPPAVVNRDLTWRPRRAQRADLIVQIGDSLWVLETRKGRVLFKAKRGTQVGIGPGRAHDRYGNTNSKGLAFRIGQPG